MSKKTDFDRVEFEKTVQPVIEWRDKNLNPHQYIVIKQGSTHIVTEEYWMSYPVPK